MAPNRDKKDKESAILQAACRVIRGKGFHQTRMADIAQEADISYGLVYHYFKNKSELFDALIREWWQELEALTDVDPGSSEETEKMLRAIVHYFFEQYESRPDLVFIFVTELSRSTANLTPERLKPFKQLAGRIEKIIKNAQGEGVLRADIKPRYLTYFFLGAVESLLSAMVLEGRPIQNKKHKQRLCDAVLNMFLDGARIEAPVEKSDL